MPKSHISTGMRKRILVHNSARERLQVHIRKEDAHDAKALARLIRR